MAFLLQRFDDHKLMIELGGGLICGAMPAATGLTSISLMSHPLKHAVPLNTTMLTFVVFAELQTLAVPLTEPIRMR